MPALTAVERERILDEASDKYMRGDMTAEDFEAVEERYMTDYSISLQALAKYLMRPTTPLLDRVVAFLLRSLLHHPRRPG